MGMRARMERELRHARTYNSACDPNGWWKRRAHLLEFVLSGRYEALSDLLTLVKHVNTRHEGWHIITVVPAARRASVDVIKTATISYLLDHREEHRKGRAQDHSSLNLEPK